MPSSEGRRLLRFRISDFRFGGALSFGSEDHGVMVRPQKVAPYEAVTNPWVASAITICLYLSMFVLRSKKRKEEPRMVVEIIT